MCVLFPENYSERHGGCGGESYCSKASIASSRERYGNAYSEHPHQRKD
jgi:hypothetical protein